MSTLASVILKDIFSNRPAASIAGRLFFSTDTLKIYRDNGASWDDVTTSSNPMTTVGDMIVGGSSGAQTRLGVGSNGQVLTVVSGTPAWQPASGGGGSSFPLTIVQQVAFQSGTANTTSYALTFPKTTAASGNTLFLMMACDGSTAVTIPAGWTSDLNIPASSFSRFILCHKASAAETGATMTVASASSFAGYFFEVSGSHALGTSANATSANATTVSPPALTAASGTAVFTAVAFTTNAGGPIVDIKSLDPNWNTIGISTFNNTGGRALFGHIYRGVGAGASIQPPPVVLPYTALFASGGVAAVTFSIT